MTARVAAVDAEQPARDRMIAGGFRTSFAALLALAAATVGAQSTGGGYSLTRHAAAGGGGRSLGGAYDLEGTLGQHDSSAVAHGDRFTLVGGYYYSDLPDVVDQIFADGFDTP
jgi:hypothetical protein